MTSPSRDSSAALNTGRQVFWREQVCSGSSMTSEFAWSRGNPCCFVNNRSSPPSPLPFHFLGLVVPFSECYPLPRKTRQWRLCCPPSVPALATVTAPWARAWEEWVRIVSFFSPIIPSALKCSSRHFIFHRKCYALSNPFPSKPSILTS